MKCELCPRKCGVDRAVTRGFCGMGDKITAAKAMLHFWEEPCISGCEQPVQPFDCEEQARDPNQGVSGTGAATRRGSGAVFFSGCVLKCVFCQNYDISSDNLGREISEERLAQIFLELQEKGAQNINLVNPTHFVPQILRSLELAKRRGLNVPIVYNSGGYERVETLRMLDGIIGVYLPDVKYFDDELAINLSKAPNYFETAMSAVSEMLRQTGKPVFNEYGTITKGVIVRHLVLPWHYRDSIEIVKRLGERFGGNILFSLMSQYTPFGKVKTDPALSKMNRRITTFEYEKVLDEVYKAGLRGFMQEKSSAKEEYTPVFDFEGL